MLPPETIMCHRTGFQISCFEGVTKHKCRLWCHVQGKDAMDQDVDVYGCADEIELKFIHEISRQLRCVAASSDKVANEVKSASEASALRTTKIARGIIASLPLISLKREEKRDDRQG
jgi:hypothetical protein